MRRRLVIAGLGSAVARTLNTRAQQGERVRRRDRLGNENDAFAKPSTF
jgi:hypothetical protein